MLLTYLMLGVALCLSAVAAFYSIAGLTAIFAAAVVPIVIMGSILEVAKLVVTVWLHEYWGRVKFTMKAYLVPAVVVLMLLTSMGIFGFLSKAHMDQTLVSGDVTSQLALLDERIKIEKENIDANRKILAQMDQQVDQVLSRSTDERGARNSANLRKGQAQERNQVQKEILSSQTKIQRLNEERAPIAAQVREVEAEVGPIKYIAAMIYGDNPDANLLERAVRWVIIVLVVVFDPLAVMMLLASTESIRWAREEEEAKLAAAAASAPPEPSPPVVETPAAVIPSEPAIDIEHVNSLLEDAAEQDKLSWPEIDIEPVPINDTSTVAQVEEKVEEPQPVLDGPADLVEQQIAEQEESNNVDSLERPGDYLIDDKEVVEVETKVGFGNEFPNDPGLGDQFILTGRLPTQLYKYNGDKWILVDKELTDHYAYNQAYIDYLIEHIASGEYDPDLLTVSERMQIESCLRQQN